MLCIYYTVQLSKEIMSSALLGAEFDATRLHGKLVRILSENKTYEYLAVTTVLYAVVFTLYSNASAKF